MDVIRLTALPRGIKFYKFAPSRPCYIYVQRHDSDTVEESRFTSSTPLCLNIGDRVVVDINNIPNQLKLILRSGLGVLEKLDGNSRKGQNGTGSRQEIIFVA